MSATARPTTTEQDRAKRAHTDVVSFLSQLSGALLTKVEAGERVPSLAELISGVWRDGGQLSLSTAARCDELNARLADHSDTVDCVIEASNGRAARRFRVAAATSQGEDGGVRLIAISDLSEVEALETAQTRANDALRAWREANRLSTDEVLRLALQDPLTHLPNRRAFDVALRAACQSGHAVLALMDLDRFKEVNDQLGHSVGDRLLGAVAARLVGKVRASDFVARFAGDEFAVILNNAQDDGDAREAMERLSASFKERFDLGDLDLRTSLTIGLARIDAGADPALVFRRADTALHCAKSAGRGSVATASEAPAAGSGLAARDALSAVKRLLAPRGIGVARRPVVSPFGGAIAETIELTVAGQEGANFEALAQTAVAFGLGPALVDAMSAPIAHALQEVRAPLGVHLRLPCALLSEKGLVERLASLTRVGALALEVPAGADAEPAVREIAAACPQHGIGVVLHQWDLSFGAFDAATQDGVTAVKIAGPILEAFLARRGAPAICEAAFESLHVAGAAVIVTDVSPSHQPALFEIGVRGVEATVASDLLVGPTPRSAPETCWG